MIGYAMGSKPASIKNYRDGSIPLFPNRVRAGINPRRDYCLKVLEEYKRLEVESFTGLSNHSSDTTKMLDDGNAKRKTGDQFNSLAIDHRSGRGAIL